MLNPQSHNLYTYVYNNPLVYVDPSGHMGWRQIDDLVLGLFDVIEDELVATFTWDTYVGLYDFGKGVFKGDITLVDIGKSLGDSAKEKVDYFAKNTPKIFGGDPTDHEVRVYGQQMGEVLSLIVRSPSALKILGNISPDIAKRLDTGKTNTSSNTKSNTNSNRKSTVNNNKGRVNAIPTKSINALPSNVQNSYIKYSQSGWNGNVPGQAQGTKAGGNWQNRDGQLPTTTSSGQPIKYQEYDVNNKLPNQGRDAERFVRGNDGSVYYTNDHYKTFIKIN